MATLAALASALELRDHSIHPTTFSETPDEG